MRFHSTFKIVPINESLSTTTEGSTTKRAFGLGKRAFGLGGGLTKDMAFLVACSSACCLVVVEKKRRRI
jgi:hypothetical protein